MRAAPFVVLVLSATAAADPAVAVSDEPSQRPPFETAPVTPAPVPPRPQPPREATAADVEGAPVPGDESGRVDRVDPGDSAFRIVARGTLFVPKLVVEGALLPLRGVVWAQERYQLPELYYRVFFNQERTIGLYPTATYESGFGASVGARFVDRNIFGEHEHVALQATTGAVTGETYREGALVSLRTGDRLSHSFQVGLDANFDRRPADPFYGIGNGEPGAAPTTSIDPRTSDTAVTTYHRYQEARVALSGDARLVDDLHVLGTGALAELKFARSTTGTPIDEVYDPAGLVGFEGGVRHAYGELELRWDTRGRGSTWEPRDLHATGSLAAVFAGRDHQLGTGGADFWRYGLELQHFWRIARGPRVLITRLHGEAVSGTRDEVPFTELPMLGGGTFLRGYSFEQFRDRAAAFGSVQYEWDLSHLVDAYVFTDAGRVFPSIDNPSLHDLRVGYGLGLELHTDYGFVLEGSIASSIDGGLFFSLSFNPVLDARARWR